MQQLVAASVLLLPLLSQHGACASSAAIMIGAAVVHTGTYTFAGADVANTM